MDAVNWAAAEVGMVMVASVFVLLIAVEVIERLKNRKVKQPARADNRIPDYEMRLVGDEALCCEGMAKIVWMDAATGKSAAIPDSVRCKLGLPAL